MDRHARLVAGAALAVTVGAGLLASPAPALAALEGLAAAPVAFAAACLGLALLRPLLAWPTTLLAVAVGYGFGPAGVPLALALIVLTSVPPYLLARRGRSGGRVATAGRRLADSTGDFRGVLASRLLPAPSDVVNIGAGVAGVPPAAFVVGTAAGELPWAVAGVLLGDSARALAAGRLDVVDPRLVAASTLAAAALLAGPAYRALASASGASESSEA